MREPAKDMGFAERKERKETAVNVFALQPLRFRRRFTERRAKSE